MKADIEELLRDGSGVIHRGEQPGSLRQRLDRMRSAGELVSILPGYLSTPEGAVSWQVRLRAGALWAGPDAVVTRHAAARLTFWPKCEIETISFAGRRLPRAQKGRPVTRSVVPPELVWLRQGLQVSCPAYTAVDLASGDDGGSIIDLALRSRMATLDEMLAAMRTMPNRAGNRRRLELLRDSRDSPWSELERTGHRLLRQRRISGWVTNAPVDTRAGRYHADILFRGARVIVEFDGWEFHSDRDAFENDRRRRNELVLAGYTVLNFTWKQVAEAPDWVVDCIVRAIG